jgi:hypothetical protein
MEFHGKYLYNLQSCVSDQNWIQIQSGQWIRIQEGKNDPQKKKKVKKFHV